jgi:hypothetical protein
MWTVANNTIAPMQAMQRSLRALNQDDHGFVVNPAIAAVQAEIETVRRLLYPD